MASGVDCVPPGQPRRCSCCGGLWCAPQPCGPVRPPEEIGFPTAEEGSFLHVTEDRDAADPTCEREEGMCPGKPSWTSCKCVVAEDYKPCYSEKEIRCFIKIIKKTLLRSLERMDEPSVCGSNFRGCGTSGAMDSSENNVHGVPYPGDACSACLACDSLETTLTNNSRTSWLQRCTTEEICGGENVCDEIFEPTKDPVRNICGFQKPVILRHEKRYQRYPHVVESDEDFKTITTKPNFAIGNIGISEEVCKWGELDVVDTLLAKRISSSGQSKQIKLGVVCEKKDKFDNLDRFSCLNRKCCATLCRQSFRWSYRLSKMWKTYTRQPHVVIHLPSMGYPSEIRRRALKSFDFLQNIQVTRLGWLANENAQVLYIVPSNQSLEIVTLFEDLIKNVRPDVTKNRLWIIQPDRREKCLTTDCLSGSRALFNSSNSYRRVKMLTAGRQTILIPGVMEEMDALIALELRTPIMGPPLKFQHHFLNKSNVAKFLQEIDINQPPFVPDLRNFAELCQGLACLMIKFPDYVTWLIKVNYGFYGLQTASVSFEKNSMREIINTKKFSSKINEEELTDLLMEILPGEMIFNKQAYKNYKEFCCDLEQYGGLVQACPYVHYEVVSLGVFVEHDTATPLVCASADVFHVPHDLTTDFGYGIPQVTMARLPLENLAVNVGIALRECQYIGYFGMDVVAPKNEDSMDKCLVVDIDPHYTDVIAFADWVRFCLGVGSSPEFCKSGVSHDEKTADESQMNVNKGKLKSPGTAQPENTTGRYAVCSGKLYSNGLSKYCGPTLVSLCEERNMRYNAKIKQGSMICPIDSERRALGLVSLYPKRSRAINEFAKGLRVLHELSLEKHNGEIKTNMLVSYRVLCSAASSSAYKMYPFD